MAALPRLSECAESLLQGRLRSDWARDRGMTQVLETLHLRGVPKRGYVGGLRPARAERG